MMRTVLYALVGLLLAGPALAEQVAVLPVEYRLVGEDAPAPEKARMVSEQLSAAIVEAGKEPLGGAPVAAALEQVEGGAACSERSCLSELGAQLGVAQVIAASVAESGALYELRIAVADREPLTGRITGPFSAALTEVKRLAGEALTPLPEPVAEATAATPQTPEGPPEPVAEPAGPDAPATPPGEDDGDEDRRVRVLRGGAWGLTAAGGAALIAGVVLLLVDDPCVEDDPQHGCKERLDTTVPGMPLAGLGGIAAGLGVAGLVFIGRDDEGDGTGDEPPAETALGVTPLPGGAAASYRVSF